MLPRFGEQRIQSARNRLSSNRNAQRDGDDCSGRVANYFSANPPAKNAHAGRRSRTWVTCHLADFLSSLESVRGRRARSPLACEPRLPGGRSSRGPAPGYAGLRRPAIPSRCVHFRYYVIRMRGHVVPATETVNRRIVRCALNAVLFCPCDFRPRHGLCVVHSGSPRAPDRLLYFCGVSRRRIGKPLVLLSRLRNFWLPVGLLPSPEFLERRRPAVEPVQQLRPTLPRAVEHDGLLSTLIDLPFVTTAVVVKFFLPRPFAARRPRHVFPG